MLEITVLYTLGIIMLVLGTGYYVESRKVKHLMKKLEEIGEVNKALGDRVEGMNREIKQLNDQLAITKFRTHEQPGLHDA